MFARERIWLTANKKRAVPDGHKDAAFLWAAEGDGIPDEAAKRFKVKDGRISPAKAAAATTPTPDESDDGQKGKTPDGDKSKKPDGDKSKSSGGDKGSSGGGLKVNKDKKS